MITRSPARRRPAVLAALAGSAAVGVVASILIFTTAHAADATVSLFTAGEYSVLAGSTVTNTGTTTLGQSLGVHPGGAVTGGPAVGGETHLADGDALQAKNDLVTAYNDAAGRTPFTSLPAELGDSTLTPGVYRIGAAQLTGQLRLNAQGDSRSVFIFQIASTLVTAANSSVIFINGVSAACNVFWQVGTSATLGTDTDFIGTIMAMASVTLNDGADLQGRALARTAAVTLDDNEITEPLCDAPPVSPTPGDTTEPTGVPTDLPTDVPTDLPTDVPTDVPTDLPTDLPTDVPTDLPTDVPTGVPTDVPTDVPSDDTVTDEAAPPRDRPGQPNRPGRPNEPGRPDLPKTGSAFLPSLVAGGSATLVLGGVLLFLARRRGVRD